MISSEARVQGQQTWLFETLQLYPSLCSLGRGNWGTEMPSSCLEPAAKEQASCTCWMWTMGPQVSAPWPASEQWERDLARVLARVQAGVACKPPSLWSTHLAPLPLPPSAPVPLSWPNSLHHCDLLRCLKALVPAGWFFLWICGCWGDIFTRPSAPRGWTPGLAQRSPGTEQVLSQVHADE